MQGQEHQAASGSNSALGRATLGDFTADARLVWLSLLAIPVGLLCAVVALVLVRLIAFFTNVFYYGSFSIPDHLIVPSGSALGWLGWAEVRVGVYAGFLLGAFGGGLLALLRVVDRKRYPFGPFMLLGALVGVLLGPPLGAWYAG